MEEIKQVIINILEISSDIIIFITSIPKKIKVAAGNKLLIFVMWFIGAKSYKITYKKKK